MTNENETVEQVYSSCENVMVWDFPDGPMKYARRFLAAHMREIAEKDAEIASLRALVKELSDAMFTAVVSHADRDKFRALVAKAREVCR